MNQTFLPFEQEIVELEERIQRLRESGDEMQATQLEIELKRRLQSLSPYERVLLARHPNALIRWTTSTPSLTSSLNCTATDFTAMTLP